MNNINQTIQPEKSTDLTRFDSAKTLVDEIFQVNGVYSEPFLIILSWLKAHLPEDAVDARDALMHLTTAAFSHSEWFNEQARDYAASLWQQQQGRPPAESAPSSGPNLSLTA